MAASRSVTAAMKPGDLANDRKVKRRSASMGRGEFARRAETRKRIARVADHMPRPPPIDLIFRG